MDTKVPCSSDKVGGKVKCIFKAHLIAAEIQSGGQGKQLIKENEGHSFQGRVAKFCPWRGIKWGRMQASSRDLKVSFSKEWKYIVPFALVLERSKVWTIIKALFPPLDKFQ